MQYRYDAIGCFSVLCIMTGEIHMKMQIPNFQCRCYHGNAEACVGNGEVISMTQSARNGGSMRDFAHVGFPGSD